MLHSCRHGALVRPQLEAERWLEDQGLLLFGAGGHHIGAVLAASVSFPIEGVRPSRCNILEKRTFARIFGFFPIPGPALGDATMECRPRRGFLIEINLAREVVFNEQ